MRFFVRAGEGLCGLLQNVETWVWIVCGKHCRRNAAINTSKFVRLDLDMYTCDKHGEKYFETSIIPDMPVQGSEIAVKEGERTGRYLLVKTENHYIVYHLGVD